jgi:pimeloyl-ACP methyl ester carboxylesterase
MESSSQSPAAFWCGGLSYPFAALIVFLLALATAPVRAQQPHKPSDQAEAKSIIANARKIVTAHGVERLEKVTIGGIAQWVSIRGTDVRNPVLLLIHGGPGYVSMPMSWWFTRGWEEYFTVVQWDQRGSGKTYLLNDPAVIGPTMTRERMLADAEEMTTWVRHELGKEKIFILGHSWGSYLGLELAERHPSWLYAYIGAGQLTDGPESERRGWRFAMDAARRAGNAEAVDQLQAIAPYFSPGQKASLEDIYTQRKWLDLFGGVMAHRNGNSAESGLVDLSPDYGSAEIAHIWDGNDFSERYLLAEILTVDLGEIRQLNCPLIIFAGRYDVNVNSEVAAAWFAKVKAPSKQFIWFENSAHLPMTEEPGKFLISLVRYARPIAEKARDVPPTESH